MTNSTLLFIWLIIKNILKLLAWLALTLIGFIILGWLTTLLISAGMDKSNAIMTILVSLVVVTWVAIGTSWDWTVCRLKEQEKLDKYLHWVKTKFSKVA